MATQDQIFTINNFEHHYVKGNSLHSFRDHSHYLIQLEKEIGVHNYAAQYLQEPITNNCMLLKMQDINFYEIIPERFDYLVQSWDTAAGTPQLKFLKMLIIVCVPLGASLIKNIIYYQC